MPHSLLTTSLLISLTIASPHAHSQVAPEPQALEIITVPETDPEVVEEWVEQLGNPDWLMRDLATLELGELDPGISLETLEGYLWHEDLSHEQRARLRLACLRRFAARPKGALGVSFGTVRVGSIEVNPINPNPAFPASNILKRGDQIAMVGDRVIASTVELRAEIISRDPDATFPITVLRENQVLHIDVQLGELSQLTGAARADPRLLIDALTLRWERLGINSGISQSVGDGLTADDWKAAAFPDNTAPDAREPEMISPRGFVLGPGVNTTPDGIRWSSSMIDVWADVGVFDQQVSQRTILIESEQAQPMIALRILLEREREQLKAELDSAPNEDSRIEIIDQLDTLTDRLDQLTSKLEPLTPQSESP
jgi:hypothetical protein